MGNYDVPLLIGAAVVAGYFILTNPDILAGIFPTSTGDSLPPGGTFEPGTGTDDSSAPSSSSSGSPCGDLCRAKDCSGYKAQCKTGCTYCCDSGPNSKPCSGSSSSSGTSSNGKVFGVNPNDCASLCRSNSCSEYKRKCTTGCKNCCNSGPNSPPCSKGGSGGVTIQSGSTSCKGGASGNCGGDCKKTCWHGQVTPGNIKDTCVSQAYSSSACSAARSKFLSLYGGMAFAYRGSAHQLAYRAAQNNWTNNGISVS